MARKQIKPHSTAAKAVATASRRTENLIDALDLTRTTRHQLRVLITLLSRDRDTLILEADELDGLATWLGLLDDNLQYIEARIDPDLDPSDPLAAYASAA